MANGGKVLVAVVAVFLWLVAEQQVTFVHGDKQLIDSTCAKALELSSFDGCGAMLVLDCHICLTGTPGSNNMDLKGLGQAVLKCASLKTYLALNFSNNKSKELDPNELRPPFIECNTQLANRALIMSDALHTWQDGHPADVIAPLQTTAQDACKCMDELKKYKGYGDLEGKITILQNFCHVAVGVIRQIH